MEIRKVTQSDDFDAVSRIYARSWKEAYKGVVPQQYLDGLSELRWVKILKESPYDNFVITDGAKYAGTSMICPARNESMPGWGEIASIYLLPEYFGKGYGKPFFENSVVALRAKGFNKIYLWVLEENLRA